MKKIIYDDVNLKTLHLTELFDLSNVEVTGDFDCCNNYLTNLIGSPHTVGGKFFCNKNKLTSLKGGPHTVGGNYDCWHNNLTSLEGAPNTVGGDFYCEFNPFISLEGIPKIIVGSFYILRNLKEKFPEEYIRSLSKIERNIVYY